MGVECCWSCGEGNLNGPEPRMELEAARGIGEGGKADDGQGLG